MDCKVVLRRTSVDAAGGSPGTSQKQPQKPTDRVTEARNCLLRAKSHLGDSRNLRADLKAGITQAVERLYQLVKEEAAAVALTKGAVIEVVSSKNTPPPPPETPPAIDSLLASLAEHSALVKESSAEMRRLQEAMERQQGQMEKTSTYASAAAGRHYVPPPPLHSLIVSSDDGNDTSSNVVDKIRTAVDARQTGIRVDKVRKAKDQKVVIGCRTRGELEAVKRRLGGATAGLKIQEAVNRDPLVMLADVLSYNTDDDIAGAILKQNQHLLGELKKDEVRVAVKYRKRARNPHECHVVVQVSPPVWKVLTRAGRAHIDLQRVRVYDQTPLVQCTKCLGFGHGRKNCTGKDDLCSHCGGPHLRAECPLHLAGEPPRCLNCKKAGHDNLAHNAFDLDCPLRRRWDAIARSTVAYC